MNVSFVHLLLSACLLVLAWLGGSGCAHQPPPAAPMSSPPPPRAETVVSKAVAWTPPVGGKAVDRILFDGKTLNGWAVADYAGRGEVEVKDGQILLGMGAMTGVTWTNKAPQMNYEISLEAMRVEGSDFFCGLTFMVSNAPCSFIVGGWGGGVVGLSSLDGEDAAHNETTKYLNFANGKWFAIRVRVTEKKIQAWIDNEPMVDVLTEGKRISVRPEVEPSQPLGVATWSTAAALRNIRLRSW